MLWAGGTALLWLLYVFVFIGTTGSTLGEAARDALANVAPLAALAAVTRIVLRDHVMPRPAVVQAAAHASLAVAFAVLWYLAVLVLLAVTTALAGGRFEIIGFSGPALTWQAFQGLIMYALVAACCYAVRGGREAATVSFVETTPPLERYLTREGDELRPVEVAEIVAITGAQDYAEVLTLDGRRHLVRMSLAEFERRLAPGRFLRVHRSTIINFTHLRRLEPAGGGRLTAHMAAGESVEVSRSGAQLLRSLVV